MASSSAPNRRSGSISGSHDIEEEVDPSQQPELTRISVDLPVLPNAAGAQRRERRITSFTRSIRSCVGWAVTRCSKVLSLTDPLAAKVIAFMSNASLVGILTLNIFSATYLLAWRKESNSCNFPFPTEVFKNADTLTRVLVIALPFICFPLASVIGAFSSVAEKDLSYLGCAASLALCEIIYILFLGSVMMSCVFNVSATYTGIAALVILCLILLLWGCCCHQPKRLRYLVLSKCCCPDVDEAA